MTLSLRAGPVGVYGLATQRGGSGQVIAPNLVLTARHLVASAGASPAAETEVVARIVVQGADPNPAGNVEQRIVLDATTSWHPQGDQPDAMLLTVRPKPGQPTLLPDRRIAFAACGTTERTAAYVHGFPRLTADEVSFENIEHLQGSAAVQTSQGGVATAISFVTAVRLAGPPGGWQGISGAAVFCGNSIVGVMREFPKAWDPQQQLDAEPLSRLATIAPFRDAVGLPTKALPIALPTRQVPPRPEFGELRPFVYAVNREEPLRQVYLALGDALQRGPLELLVSGHPEDGPDRFFELVWRKHTCPPLANTPEHLRPMPLRGLGWPERVGAATAADELLKARQLLAGELAESQGTTKPLRADEQRLRAMIKNLLKPPYPAWRLLRFPPSIARPDSVDLTLLREWRAAFSAAWQETRLEHAEDFAAGYMVALPNGGASPELTEASQLAGCVQLHVRLSRVTLTHLRDWPGKLPIVGQDASAQRVVQLAEDFADAVEASGFQALRVEEVARLVRGSEGSWATLKLEEIADERRSA